MPWDQAHKVYFIAHDVKEQQKVDKCLGMKWILTFIYTYNIVEDQEIWFYNNKATRGTPTTQWCQDRGHPFSWSFWVSFANCFLNLWLACNRIIVFEIYYR